MDKLKLAGIALAAFTAGEYIMRHKAFKAHTRILKEEKATCYHKAFADGWSAALNDAPSVTLAHSRLTRPTILNHSKN